MQNNEFYKGLLFELHKSGVDANSAPSVKPASSPSPNISTGAKSFSQPTTQQPPLPPSTQPSKTPFNFGNIKMDNTQQNWVNDIVNNKQIYQPYINRAENYTASRPSMNDFNEAEMEKEMYQTGAQNIEDKGIEGYARGNGAIGGFIGAGKGIINAYQDSNRVRQSFDTFKKWDPEHQLQAVNEVAAHDPDLARFLNKQINRGITEHVNQESFGDIAGDAWHSLTGASAGKPNDINNNYNDVLMKDQNVKEFANNALLGRAGALTGEFLKNNWGKLSAVIGTAGLISLIYSLMKNRQQALPQPPAYQQPGPRFL